MLLVHVDVYLTEQQAQPIILQQGPQYTICSDIILGYPNTEEAPCLPIQQYFCFKHVYPPSKHTITFSIVYITSSLLIIRPCCIIIYAVYYFCQLFHPEQQLLHDGTRCN